MHEIKISQLGEGLTEVRIVALLKSEGDLLVKDEPLLEVETDKAVMEIETPYGGLLRKWLVQAGETVDVAAVVALIEESPNQNSVTPETPALSPASKVRNRALSPREKAALKAQPSASALRLSAHQKRQGELFLDSQSYIVEASITMRVRWDGLTRACHELKDQHNLQQRPTTPELIAWCVTRAMKAHPRLLVLNLGAQGYETQSEVCLGNAVALPDDELAVAPLLDASTLDLGEFIGAMRRGIADVKAGRGKAGRCQLLISHMANHRVLTATPRVIFPSIATLFVGAPSDVPAKAADGSVEWQRFSNFVLTFDHRVLNGAGAAAFLGDVVDLLENSSERGTQ